MKSWVEVDVGVMGQSDGSETIEVYCRVHKYVNTYSGCQ